MKTPAGKECRFYYENFHRGRDTQECRLVQANPNSPEWRPRDCSNCPVPDILRANNDPNMVLEGTIKRGLFGLGARKVEVRAYCSKHLIDIPDPFVGCPICAQEKPGLEELFNGIE